MRRYAFFFRCNFQERDIVSSAHFQYFVLRAFFIVNTVPDNLNTKKVADFVSDNTIIFFRML